jgi:hypothetical protein
MNNIAHAGSCHCKAVRFSFQTPPGPVRVSICNCSICTMKGLFVLFPTNSGFEHLIVPKENFTLDTSWDAVKTYQFGTGVAKHHFCGTCGISPFYVPRSNPNGYSVKSVKKVADMDRLIFDALTERASQILCGTTSMDRIGSPLLRKVISVIGVERLEVKSSNNISNFYTISSFQ